MTRGRVPDDHAVAAGTAATASAIRLVCLDVDGTLVDTRGDVPAEVWRLTTRLREAGVHLAVCSGRPGFGVTLDLARRLEPDGWHVFQNGASVVHLAGGRSRSSPLPPGTVGMLVERARRTNRLLELYTDEEYACELDTDRARRHADLLGVPFRPRPLDSLRAAVVRAQWLVAREDAHVVLAESYPGLEVQPSTAPLMPDTEFVNLTAAGVDKGQAVRMVAAEYGVPLEQVMFVGDGRNDVAALRLAGLSVAMGNAEPEARAAAAIAVAHVDEGGLAEALAMVAGA